MKKTVFLSIVLISLLFSGHALAAKVHATVDGKCQLHPATITVPAGKTATGFKLVSLTNGKSCVTGGTPDNKGWGITKNGQKVYYWNKFKRNAPTVKGGPLSSLSLSPGTYKVFVDGGSGARAAVQYTLK